MLLGVVVNIVFSFDSEQYPDLLVHCIPSTSKLRLPLGIRIFHDNFCFRKSFLENFHYFCNFSLAFFAKSKNIFAKIRKRKFSFQPYLHPTRGKDCKMGGGGATRSTISYRFYLIL
jgi:hypothetical protein